MDDAVIIRVAGVVEPDDMRRRAKLIRILPGDERIARAGWKEAASARAREPRSRGPSLHCHHCRDATERAPHVRLSDRDRKGYARAEHTLRTRTGETQLRPTLDSSPADV